MDIVVVVYSTIIILVLQQSSTKIYDEINGSFVENSTIAIVVVLEAESKRNCLAVRIRGVISALIVTLV